MSYYAGSYNGLTWGATGASPYTVATATGFEDLPSLRRRATPRSQQDGQWFGRFLLDQHILTMELHIQATATKSVDQACRDLLQNTPRLLDSTLPLLFDSSTKMAMVKVSNRSIVRDVSGNYASAHIQFEMPDMRIYENPVRQLVLSASPTGMTAGGQVPQPVPFAIVQQSFGQGTATNVGNETTYPVVVITGPAPNPQLLNGATNKRVHWGVTLNANDQLLVDFLAQSAVLNGQTAVVEVGDSDWWGLVPGANPLHYVNDLPDPASSATVQWRSAWA